MKTKDEIAQWCVDFIATTFEIDPVEVERDAEFQSFGFDSTALVSFSAEIEEWLGHEIHPSALFEHPTIDSLSAFVVEQYK
ncbi:acyl carrier protein [Variovorax sp. OV700]|uniref:acyl carrier protein n=1 Tax=Variovorax sp. OV700 TaxID=1882826 RepID=UPI000886E539|nr:acyl carrier protein [Variovorax sp. OV700]SDH56168.1 Acyl carrier protein [Variovorax sp. OV700]